MFAKVLSFLWILSLSSNLLAREIDFTWQAFPEAYFYELQVSPTRDFKEISFNKKTRAPQVKANLGMGQYYYRVRAFDTKKRPGVWSKPVLLSIAPYPPKPKSPAKGAKYNFFEKKNEIPFSWEKLDGDVSYELLIQKTSGKTVLEKKTRKNEIIINSLEAGDYAWKVRAVINKRMITQYSEPHFLFITKTPIKSPTLIKPLDKSSLPAYRDDIFEWDKDEVTKYTDIHLERLDKKEKTILIKNIEATQNELPMLMPGKYRWKVTTKETEDSPGLDSEWAEFQTSSATLSKDNHIFRLGTGLTRSSYSYTSTRTSGLTTAGTDTHLNLSLYTRIQIKKTFSIAFDLLEQDISIDDKSLTHRKNTILTEFRFGESDFQQVTFLGWRQMNQFDFVSSTEQLLTTQGFIFGFGMDGYLTNRTKVRLAFTDSNWW